MTREQELEYALTVTGLQCDLARAQRDALIANDRVREALEHLAMLGEDPR